MVNGFVVASSESTSVAPNTFWTGTGFVPEKDSAKFYLNLSEARSVAGTQQVDDVTVHVEAYPSSLNIVVGSEVPTPAPSASTSPTP